MLKYIFLYGTNGSNHKIYEPERALVYTSRTYQKIKSYLIVNGIVS